MELMRGKTWGVVTAVTISISLLAGCKPRNEPVENKQVEVKEEQTIPLIQAKTEDGEISGRVEIETKDEAGKYNVKENSENFAETIINSAVEELKKAIILTEEEKEKIDDGYNMDIWLEVEDATENVTE